MENGSIPCDKKHLPLVPTTSGIYIFLEKGIPVYIGKSVNLKARLASHMENAKTDAKEAAILQAADTIQYILTDSEFKALILEAQLINTHLPKYNVRWRDDKSYLYIKVTVKEMYPKFVVTRREDDKDSLYFGPFSSVRIASGLLREIRRIFPFCSQKRITKQLCFYAKIGLCNPCPNMIEKIEDAEEKKRLRKLYKSNIRSIIKVLEGNTEPVVSSLYKELAALSDEQKFEDAIILRDRIYRLEQVVLRKKFGEDFAEYNLSEKGLKDLQELLKYYYPDFPRAARIECYDMSTFQFTESTASMVVFTDGLSDRKEYRKFKIKDEKAQSDFEMITEVLNRRLNHTTWPLPDLFVIDGGRPQVRTAQAVLDIRGIKIPLIGIAKRPDRILISSATPQTIRPPYANHGFRMIQALRDESHRFAKKYHVKLRNKNLV